MLQLDKEEIDKMMLEADIEHEKKKKWYLCTDEVGVKFIFPDTTAAHGHDLYETYRFKREPIPPDTIVLASPLKLLSNTRMLVEFIKEIPYREFESDTMMMFTKMVTGKECPCGIWLPDEADECPHCKKKIRLCSCVNTSFRKASE